MGRGALVALLPSWSVAVFPVHAYLPIGRSTRVAARACVDFSSAELVGHQDWVTA